MIKTFISDFSENTYIIQEKDQAVIIDPGAKFEELVTFVEDNNLTVQYILLTHGHVDHIFNLNECVEHFNCDVYIHEKERDFLFDPNLNLSSTIYKKITLKEKLKAKTFDESTVLKLPYNNIEITHTPGHTRGSSTFKYKHFLFSGDTIFSDDVGRTDLPTGSQKDLENSINKLLNKYKDNTVVYPGHGSFTTVATLKNNCIFYRN